MDPANRSKWQVRAAAALIFVLGFSAGSLAFVTYQRLLRPGPPGPAGRFERVIEDLHLDPEQKTQVHQIIGEAREQLQALRRETEPRFEQIRRHADERLQKVLTPEQWQQYQRERDELRRRGRRGGGNSR